MSCFEFALPCLPASLASAKQKEQRAGKPRPVNGAAIEVDLGPRKPAPPVLLARLQGPRRSDDMKMPAANKPRVPLSKEAAEKARARNDEKRAVASRVREERERENAARLVELQQGLARAAERRSEVLVGISKKAQAHVQAVAERASRHRQQIGDRSRRLQQQLQRDRSAALRHGQASSHNKLVAEKLQQHRENKRLQIEQLRAKVVGGPRLSLASLSGVLCASSHNKLVAEKLQQHREKKSLQIEELRAKVVGGPRPSSASSRGARCASRHNKLVAEKLQQHREKKSLQIEQLRAKVAGGPRPSSASSRGARSAHHNLKVRSKVQLQQLLMKQREEALKAKLEDKASRVARRIVQKSGQQPVAAVAA